jgi:hypothetical protein
MRTSGYLVIILSSILINAKHRFFLAYPAGVELTPLIELLVNE